jgi:hypothetical protein
VSGNKGLPVNAMRFMDLDRRGNSFSLGEGRLVRIGY